MVTPTHKTPHWRDGVLVARLILFILAPLLILVSLAPSRSTKTGKPQVLRQEADDDVYSATPMCSAWGVCGETPHVPSPRTIYSAKSRAQYELWWEAHAKLNASAAEYVAHRRDSNKSSLKPPLVLLGDSITEEWLGTNMGLPDKRWRKIPNILREVFLPAYDSLVLAIGGDQTQHLLLSSPVVPFTL